MTNYDDKKRSARRSKKNDNEFLEFMTMFGKVRLISYERDDVKFSDIANSDDNICNRHGGYRN